VEDAYKVYFTDHRMEMDKKSNTVNAVNEESDSAQNDQQDVAAFRQQQRPQNRAFQSSSNRGNNRSRGQNNKHYNNGNRQNYQNYNQSSQPKSNNSGNGKFCAYCKILNHSQEECRKRIKDNKPCVTNSGKLYWPKVNSTNDNPNTVQQNSNPNAIESVFH
jgi:hypothetical protein